MEYSSVEAYPCFLTVNAAFPFSADIITLIGSSFIPGIQTIANCPGKTFDRVSSENKSVRTVGVSSIIFSIFTTYGMSGFLCNSYHVLYFVKVLSLHVFGNSIVYFRKYANPFFCKCTTNLYGTCSCQYKLNCIIPT